VVDCQCFLGGLLVVAFAGLLLVAGFFLSEPLIKLIDLMFMMWVEFCGFVGSYLVCFHFLFCRFFAGCCRG